MLHFAVAGIPTSTPSPGGTVEGMKEAKRLGITAMEIEWVQRVPENEERMLQIREAKTDYGIELTCHAPYYINLNSPDKTTLQASKKRILTALRMSEIAGIRSVCIHAAYYLGMDEKKVYDNVRSAVDEILKEKKKFFPHVNLGLETMGKHSQFGTLLEVLKISKEFDLYPVLDPAHMHARANGGVNTKEEWREMFDLYEEYLGTGALKHVHMHYAGIAYGPKGEKHHLPLEDSDARWRDFLAVLYERGVEGNVVCESPRLEKDTLLLQKTYRKLQEHSKK